MNIFSIVLRVAGVLAALLFAGLGILFVLDLIPREDLIELGTRGGLAIVILAATGLGIALLVRKG
ncbi:MAG: hypothetical protein L0Y32_02630 [Nevskiales bacterium]|nr:hypothetical protein [Nevskiales bacterium]